MLILERPLSPLLNFPFNPILTGGGGQFDTPPARKSATTLATAADRDTPFHDLFSFKSCASFDTKFAKIGLSVARSRDVLYSHVGTKFAQNLHFCIGFVYKNTWKLLIFLKCTKTVFYSVFLAICTISYILKLIKIKLQEIKKYNKNNEIHKK